MKVKVLIPETFSVLNAEISEVDFNSLVSFGRDYVEVPLTIPSLSDKPALTQIVAIESEDRFFDAKKGWLYKPSLNP